MSRARVLADLLDSTGDVKLANLDNTSEYTKPSSEPITYISGLQTALNDKIDDTQVLTNVPSSAVFTDTTYSVGDGGLTTKDFTTTLKSKLDGVADSANNYSRPSAEAIAYITGLQTALNGKQVSGSYLAPTGNGSQLTNLPDTGGSAYFKNIHSYFKTI